VTRFIALLPVIVLLGAVPFLPQDSSSPKPAEFSVPPDIAAKTNPVHSTPESLAKAKKMYGYDCAMCHGANGDGKGDMASSLKTPMKNYHDPTALKGMTDGEIFYIIQKGKGEMPGEGDRMNADGIWNMVSLVQSFSKK
jgi:mono/diheme cytochrome c family protein